MSRELEIGEQAIRDWVIGSRAPGFAGNECGHGFDYAGILSATMLVITQRLVRWIP
jgi:hypothetical protein